MSTRKKASVRSTEAQRWFNRDGLLIGSGGRLYVLDDRGRVVQTFLSQAEYDRMIEEQEADSAALCRAEALQDADRAMLPSGCLQCGDPVFQDGPDCLDCAIDAHNEPIEF